MVIGIDIDNTITHTTETIMHYARIFGEQRGLTTPDPRYYYLEDTLGWDKAVAEEFFPITWAAFIVTCCPKSRLWK